MLRPVRSLHGIPVAWDPNCWNAQTHGLRLTQPDWEVPDDELLASFETLWDSDLPERLEAFVLGEWCEFPFGSPSTPYQKHLVANADRLSKLRALFLGDVPTHIYCVSHGDVSDCLHAFGQLEEIGIRGCVDLTVDPLHLPRLKRLVIEGSGISGQVVRNLVRSKLPALADLELWVGDEDFGFDEDFEPYRDLLAELGRFPCLKRLALRNAGKADTLAELVRDATTLDGLEVLDLSLGALHDLGGERLLDARSISPSCQLDLHWNYLGSEVTEALHSRFPRIHTQRPDFQKECYDYWQSVDEPEPGSVFLAQYWPGEFGPEWSLRPDEEDRV